MPSDVYTDALYQVYFRDRVTGEICELDDRLSWSAAYDYRLSQPGEAALIYDTRDDCCPKCLPVEGRDELVIIQKGSAGGDALRWVGPVVLVEDDSPGEIVIAAADRSWWAWNARCWRQDVQQFDVDSGLALRRAFDEADRNDPSGLQYVTKPTGIQTDIIVFEGESLEGAMSLGATTASYTVIGDTAYVGDISIGSSKTITAADWEEPPKLSRNLGRLAGQVVVRDSSGTYSGRFPDSVDIATQRDLYGAEICIGLEANGLRSDGQAQALAEAQWRTRQSPYVARSGSGSPISKRFPIGRDDLRPGLSTVGTGVGRCLAPIDVDVTVSRVEFKIVNGEETDVEADFSTTPAGT